jgi:hypothetical protein
MTAGDVTSTLEKALVTPGRELPADDGLWCLPDRPWLLLAFSLQANRQRNHLLWQ